MEAPPLADHTQTQVPPISSHAPSSNPQPAPLRPRPQPPAHLWLLGVCPQFKRQVTMGVGTPVATQVKVTVWPGTALTDSRGSVTTCGGTATAIRSLSLPPAPPTSYSTPGGQGHCHRHPITVTTPTTGTVTIRPRKLGHCHFHPCHCHHH